VIGHEVLRPTDALGELTDLAVAPCQLLDELPTLLVCQQLEEPAGRDGRSIQGHS
jgi:hypothetical protein